MKQLYSMLSEKLTEMAQQRHPERDYSELRRKIETDKTAKGIQMRQRGENQ